MTNSTELRHYTPLPEKKYKSVGGTIFRYDMDVIKMPIPDIWGVNSRPKTYEELNKKVVNASDVKEGDYIYPHELSETKAKWKDKGFTSNLKRSFYKVLKVSKKSLRVEDLVDGEVATVDKEKWRDYGKEISFTKILDKKEIDRQLAMR